VIMRIDQTELAQWGAVTGTIGTVAGIIALGIQTLHWLVDRAKLKVEAHLAIVHTDTVP
jgi:hypothetical protein